MISFLFISFISILIVLYIFLFHLIKIRNRSRFYGSHVGEYCSIGCIVCVFICLLIKSFALSLYAFLIDNCVTWWFHVFRVFCIHNSLSTLSHIHAVYDTHIWDLLKWNAEINNMPLLAAVVGECSNIRKWFAILWLEETNNHGIKLRII